MVEKCVDGKIYNKYSGKYISKTGKIGQSILHGTYVHPTKKDKNIKETYEYDTNLSEEANMLQIIYKTYIKYFNYGSRSPKKVDYFHEAIKDLLVQFFFLKEKGYDVKTEYCLDSFNCSNQKVCDIVVLKNSIPYIIFPVKLIMTNYKQNRNNYMENLTGEITLIKWKNPSIHIIPINIIMSQVPYLKNSKKIKNFETITTNDFKNYNELLHNNLCHDVINYIVQVEHSKKENEYFNEIPSITKFQTEYKPFSSILKNLL